VGVFLKIEFSTSKIQFTKDNKNAQLFLIFDNEKKYLLEPLKKVYTKSEIYLYIQDLKNILNTDKTLLKKIKHYIIHYDDYAMRNVFLEYNSKIKIEKYINMPHNILTNLIILSVADFSLESLKYKYEYEYEIKNKSKSRSKLKSKLNLKLNSKSKFNLKFNLKSKLELMLKIKLNFEHDLFDAIDENCLKIFDEILNLSKTTNIVKNRNKDYIDIDLWKEYEQKKEVTLFHTQSQSWNITTTDIFFNSDFGIININTDRYYIYAYEGEWFFQQQLLLQFICMLFKQVEQEQPHFIIKKCAICNKYFITTHNSTKLCSRKYEFGLTHSELKDKNKDLYENISILRKMKKDIAKRIREKCEINSEGKDKTDYTEYDNFKKELNTAMAISENEAFNYLNNFYKKNTQQKHLNQYKEELEKLKSSRE
jgi:hypothetical protein